MSTLRFDELSYAALSDSSPITVATIKPFCKKHPTRVLDVGCGTGENLFALSKSIPNAIFTGVDISAINIQKAKASITQSDESRFSFHSGDYLNYETTPFDVIYADSVLHLIDAPDAALYKKLSNDLQPEGILIATMPYDCLYNRMLFGIRRLFKMIRSNRLDQLLLKIAMRVYPSIHADVLKDRIHYMYLIPHRIDSASFRKLLEKNYQLMVIESKLCQSPSLAKPKHKLIIFQKMM